MLHGKPAAGFEPVLYVLRRGAQKGRLGFAKKRAVERTNCQTALHIAVQMHSEQTRTWQWPLFLSRPQRFCDTALHRYTRALHRR